MFLNSPGFFLVCSYSCRGRRSVTFIQVKSRHSSTWLGGKTYGGCLTDTSQMPPDASQMLPRCLHDATRMPPHDSQMLSTRPSLLGSSLQPRFVNKHCLGSSAWVIQLVVILVHVPASPWEVCVAADFVSRCCTYYTISVRQKRIQQTNSYRRYTIRQSWD